jgi:phosphate transport system substrate-binding protein
MRSVSRRLTIGLLGLGALWAASACSKKSKDQGTERGENPASAISAGGTVKLIGSGATFPAPIYGRWFKEFSTAQKDIVVDYQGVGSGQGIKAFLAGHTDFGASDAAMSDEEIAQAQGNVLLLPMTAGAIVLAYNLPGVTDVKLTRETYSQIFSGKIKNWNDPKIAASNPGVKLPSTPVSPVYRSDGSGTTFVFTQHLSAISPEWKSGPGVGKSIEWPAGVGAKGNDGVSAQIKQIPGGIGYVEYAYAVLSKQPMAALENHAGKFVAPSLEASAASLANVELPADFRAWVTDPAGDGSYPIVTYTWILAKKKYEDPRKAEALKSVLNWSLTEGQKLSAKLEYVPLPVEVAGKVRTAVSTIQ